MCRMRKWRARIIGVRVYLFLCRASGWPTFSVHRCRSLAPVGTCGASCVYTCSAIAIERTHADSAPISSPQPQPTSAYVLAHQSPASADPPSSRCLPKKMSRRDRAGSTVSASNGGAPARPAVLQRREGRGDVVHERVPHLDRCGPSHRRCPPRSDALQCATRRGVGEADEVVLLAKWPWTVHELREVGARC